MPEIGQTVSHYKIIEKLGQGGMGVVYRAEDTSLGRQVAVKVLPEAFAQDPERMARFEREAKLLASLSRQNIAAIHGLEQDQGKRFLVLELVEGKTSRRNQMTLPVLWHPEFARVIACTQCTKAVGPYLRRDRWENVLQPGFIGTNYAQHRVLFVGQNPGTPAILALLLTPGPLWPWGRLGHRASAMLAESRLTPAALAAVRDLLEPGEDLAGISTWADQQREIPRTGTWHSGINKTMRGKEIGGLDCLLLGGGTYGSLNYVVSRDSSFQKPFPCFFFCTHAQVS